jgi:hypothetical protein
LRVNRKKRLEIAYHWLVGACIPAARIPVPHIGKDETMNMVRNLRKAAAAVDSLRQKIERTWKS